MKKSFKNRYKNVSQHLLDKSVVSDSIQKSVISVLSNSDTFSDMVGSPNVIEEITSTVFKQLYKKDGNAFIKTQNTSFKSLADAIIFSASHTKKIEEAKKQIKETAEYIRTNPENSVTLDVIQASLCEKLDASSSKELDFFESKYKKLVDRVIYAGSGVSLKDSPPRSDLLYLDLILVTEGTNKNKDTILATELKKSYLTLIGMPLVEEHIPTSIHGVFYDSQLVHIKPGKVKGSVRLVKSGGRLAVRAKAYIYKRRFPRAAALLKARDEQGLLRYSVELGFTEVECSECGQVFKPGQPLCEHLYMRNEVERFSRIAKNIYFVGGAYTVNPAEPTAVSLDVTEVDDKSVTKKAKSSVINNEDLSKVVSNYKDSGQQRSQLSIGAVEAARDNGGQRMKFVFESVEDMLASKEFNALMETKVNELMSEERDIFESSLQELTEAKEAADTKVADLENVIKADKEKITEIESKLVEIAKDKRATDSIIELQASGYHFDSDEEITAFTNQLATLDDDQTKFVVELMKKGIVAASSESGGDDQDKQNADPSTETSVLASQNADASVSAPEDTLNIAGIRSNWTNSVKALTN